MATASSACSSSSARSATAPALTRPPGRPAARATSSMASPPRITSPSAARVRCAMKSAPPARWPTPPDRKSTRLTSSHLGLSHAEIYTLSLPDALPIFVNGEPTENHLALGSKGALRYEVCATGKMAHSAYPELGESAIDKLLDALADIRRIPLPVDALLGPSTLNIGTLSGGRAPNVIADEARADIMIRLVGDSGETKAALQRAGAGRAELREVIEIPAARLGAVEGIPTTVVAFTTDIPAFNGVWGEPFLIGPGTIHVAHTLEERVRKTQLTEAVDIYQRIVKELCKRESK